MFSRIEAENFASRIINEIHAAGLSTSGWIIDHICYRTSSLNEYMSLRSLPRSADLSGQILSDAIVNGRPIATIRLDKPVSVSEFLIEALEIPAPRSDVQYKSGFEHIEVVTTKSFEHLLSEFRDYKPKMSAENDLNQELVVSLSAGKVKFHRLPLSGVISIENETDLYRWLNESSILTKLAPWDAIVSGSIPIGVHNHESDLDILLHAASPDSAVSEITEILRTAGTVSWSQNPDKPHEYWASLTGGPREVGLFLSGQPVLEQNGHRHLLTEYRYLVREGDGLRRQIIQLKSMGLTTEEAFAKALGLKGDPYESLLV